MKTFSKALAGTIAAGAMTVSSATPALARNGDGIDAGDVIAGAVVLGGIAAIAVAASDRDRDYGYERAGYRSDYGRHEGDRYRGGFGRDNPREAVAQCVRTAERMASRHAYGQADVTDIRSVRDTRYGFEVKGRIAVNTMGRGWRTGDHAYGRGWGGDYRGWNSSMRGYDAGQFTCRIERGRVIDIDFRGIRGLR